MRLGEMRLQYSPTTAAGNTEILAFEGGDKPVLIHLISFTLSTTVAANDRWWGIKFIRAGLQSHTVVGNAGAPPNSIYLVAFFDRATGAVVGTQVNCSMPPQIALPGMRVLCAPVSNNVAGDSIGNVQVMYQQVLDWA